MRAVRTIAAVAVAVAGAAAMHTSVGAYSTYARWASSPVTFYVNPVNADVSQSAAVAALQAGMDVWNTQSGTSFRYQYGGTATDTATVHVFAAPKVSINTVGSPTAGVPVTFEVHADDPAGTAITSYEMVVSGDENFLLDGASAPPAPPAPLDVPFSSGTYTVVFTFTNDAGGTATSDPLVLVVP